MRIPGERMGFVRTWEGVTEENGFVTLDLKGLDMEGVTRLVLRWSDLETVRTRAVEGESAARKLRDLLSE